MIHRRGSQSICSLCLGSCPPRNTLLLDLPSVGQGCSDTDPHSHEDSWKTCVYREQRNGCDFAPNPMTFLSSLPHPSPYAHGLFNATLTT